MGIRIIGSELYGPVKVYQCLLITTLINKGNSKNIHSPAIAGCIAK